MTGFRRAFTGVVLTTLLGVGTLYADPVELSLHDGLLSLTATNATPAEIFQAWSRAGGVLVVNAEKMPATPVTLTIENVPEEQALDTLLRAVSGYMARRRTEPAANASVFDRIVIMPTPVGARPPSAPAPPPAARPGSAGIVFPQPPPPQRQPVIQAPQNPPPPSGIPQAPGVTRLIGPDGRPIEDDQADAPQQQPYTPGDAPDTRAPIVRPAPMPPQTAPPPQQQPAPPATSAPAGVPRPGMVVPAPNTPGQPGTSTPGQPTQPAPSPQR
jgi:hypothetical protein